MKVLVLGAGGMAGHVVSLYLKENGLTVDTQSARNTLDKDTHLIDAMDIQKLETLLEYNQYDVVINCIGLLVKQSEERKDLAVYLNAYLPHFLENYYKDSSTKIIHVSSNGVFASKGPHQEEDIYDGNSFYGHSKALGEIINEKDLTLRLSIIGPEIRKDGTSLFNWFYNQTGTISGYTNVLWNGITTIELAKAICAALRQEITGIYHLVPNETISKFDLLQLFKEVFARKDVTINPIQGESSDSTLINTRKDFDFSVLPYDKMIEDMKVWISEHSRLYPHYGK